MPTTKGSGTQTAVIGTEHTLNGAAFTDAGVYVLEVDVNGMADGDILELRLKTNILSGGVVRVVYLKRYFNAQIADDKIKISIPVPSMWSFTATLKQTAGTGRDFPWSVLTI